MPADRQETTHRTLTGFAAQKGISRRAFMERAAALGLSVGAASAIWTKQANAAPKKGGHARFGLAPAATTDSLDPASGVPDTHMVSIYYSIRGNLTEIGPDGGLEPELAESWEASNGGATWTFKLRQGVEFHNGKTLDADDVVATFNHHRGEDSKSGAKDIADQIADIRADGKDTVVMDLTAGNADFPFVLGFFLLGILPAKDGVVDWQSGVGTGGYAIENLEPGVTAALKRNPNYWRDDRAHFDSIEALAINDAGTRITALTAGDVDAINSVELKVAERLKATSGLAVDQVAGTRSFIAAMNTTAAPFDNNDVRMALKLALDREDALQKIVQGYGVIGNDHPITPANRYYADDIPLREYDPEKAKYHLKQAGLDSLDVALHTADAGFPGAVDFAVLYAEHAKAAGINLEVVREPSDGYWNEIWMKKPWVTMNWAGRPTEDWIFTVSLSKESNWNDTFWTDERFEQLLVEARTVLDDDKRREMYREMQLIVRDKGGMLTPIYPSLVSARSEKIQNSGQIAGNFEMDGAHAFERWWMAS